MKAHKERVGYEIFMLALSIFVLILLFVSNIPNLDPDVAAILNMVDFGVCMIFLVDFLVSFFTAPSKLAYMKWGWIDLLSSIPMFDAGRVGRVARILRVIRLLRALRSASYVMKYISRHRPQSIMLSMFFMMITMITIGSICILHFEQEANSNIVTAEDAVWWAFVTITTVGYGDYYPVTSGGRLIAAALMFAGIGVFGSYAGYMATWFTNNQTEEPGAE